MWYRHTSIDFTLYNNYHIITVQLKLMELIKQQGPPSQRLIDLQL